MKRHQTLPSIILIFGIFTSLLAENFHSHFPQQERTWIGPEYWANQLQDWRVKKGRLECLQGNVHQPMRTVYLLPFRLGEATGDLTMDVRAGLLDSQSLSNGANPNAAVGFLIGAGGEEMDPRSALLIHHSPGPRGGFFAGVNGKGDVFIREFSQTVQPEEEKQSLLAGKLNDISLSLTLKPSRDRFLITLTAINNLTKKKMGKAEKVITEEEAFGNVALVSHPGEMEEPTATARFWFQDWKVHGSKLKPFMEKGLGPIISSQYLFYDSTLSLNAQLTPVKISNHKVKLEMMKDGKWTSIAESSVQTPSYTASFKVKPWNTAMETPYRLSYTEKEFVNQYWEGIIKKELKGSHNVRVGVFYGSLMTQGNIGVNFPWNTGVYFPHKDITQSVKKQNIDLLFFAGGQVYPNIPTYAVNNSTDNVHLDYLYKWFLWCLTWRDLTRNTPSIVLPTQLDHISTNKEYSLEKDSIWSHMIEYTQEGHMPNKKAPQQISIGDVDFALLPTTSNAHESKDSVSQRKKSIEFLQRFAKKANKKGQKLNVVFSDNFLHPQLASHSASDSSPSKGGSEHSNWIQNDQRSTLAAMNSGTMLHISGGETGSVIHYGINTWDDGPWSFVVPPIAKLTLELESPLKPFSWKRKSRDSSNSLIGKFEDEYKNKFSVLATAHRDLNPKKHTYQEPVELYAAKPGYGVIEANTKEGTLTIECWPRSPNLIQPTSKQYTGWPIIIRQKE